MLQTPPRTYNIQKYQSNNINQINQIKISSHPRTLSPLRGVDQWGPGWCLWCPLPDGLMQEEPKLQRLAAEPPGLSAQLRRRRNQQAAEFLLTRRLAACCFKTLITVPSPMWQLKDCAAVIIAPINKTKAAICFLALNTICHLTNECKGNI